jgi:hypothetical protein
MGGGSGGGGRGGRSGGGGGGGGVTSGGETIPKGVTIPVEELGDRIREVNALEALRVKANGRRPWEDPIKLPADINDKISTGRAELKKNLDLINNKARYEVLSSSQGRGGNTAELKQMIKDGKIYKK